MRAIAIAAIALSGLLAACDLPHDANGTLSRVKGGVLRVGVSENRPWTNRADTLLVGPEVRIVAELARELGAKPSWRVGSESVLLAALEARELDLVIGGLTASSPWSGRVALTRPYEGGAAPTHVMATAAGENAWLVHVERFLATRAPGASE